jgi:hypothetical protein
MMTWKIKAFALNRQLHSKIVQSCHAPLRWLNSMLLLDQTRTGFTSFYRSKV